MNFYSLPTNNYQTKLSKKIRDLEKTTDFRYDDFSTTRTSESLNTTQPKHSSTMYSTLAKDPLLHDESLENQCANRKENVVASSELDEPSVDVNKTRIIAVDQESCNISQVKTSINHEQTIKTILQESNVADDKLIDFSNLDKKVTLNENDNNIDQNIDQYNVNDLVIFFKMHFS